MGLASRLRGAGVELTRSLRRAYEVLARRWHTSAMTDVLLLLPDFLLILAGFLICRYTALKRDIWEPAERLVYYLLFPVLLFSSIVRSPLQPLSALSLAGCGIAVVSFGVMLSFALKRWPGVDARLHASGAQTAFRFNSILGLALADRLYGPQGVTWMALLIALCVPICNVAAVLPLARHGGHSYTRELLRNPLIIATVAGLIGNLAGLHLPDAMATTMQRIGQAALPVGLMAVGAGLQFGALRASPSLAAAFLGIRHAALPIIAIALTGLVDLSMPQRVVVVAFASLPTASSAYVLAARMGGDGAYVAGLVTVSTLLGMVSVPVWLAVLGMVA
ncbi:AEC family transporter [soil metagenome]